ncbi:MAG: hypothetical protein BEN18_09930 [Epulopiscium sp. Nuni2H_MBin001]|nr:MAG: hypothetical protein BEN18_09930 [Epulopiscium sp. Nuni2H_MBin001]
MSYKEINITSPDNEVLYAKEFVNNNSSLWAIVVHGYTVSHSDIQDVAQWYYEQGYSVLTPDLRAHGFSTGEHITLGQEDGPDIVRWANYIADNYTDAKIVLHGFSMGAATVMIAAGEENLPYNVVAVIEDSGYSTAIQMVREQLKYRFNLPSFPIVPISHVVAKWRTGVNLYAPRPIHSLKHCSVPIMFIHGDEDNFVLPYMQTDLYEAYGGPKEILRVAGAGHVASRFLVPDLYYSKIDSFLKEYI